MKFIPGSGTAVANFTIAVNRAFKKEGFPDADFIPVVVFGKQAEATANYMSKGSLVGITGNIQTRNYEAKDGTRKYITEVVAEHVEFMDSKKQEGTKAPVENKDITPIDDGDIPF